MSPCQHHGVDLFDQGTRRSRVLRRLPPGLHARRRRFCETVSLWSHHRVLPVRQRLGRVVPQELAAQVVGGNQCRRHAAPVTLDMSQLRSGSKRTWAQQPARAGRRGIASRRLIRGAPRRRQARQP